jgi:hypothetical protein
VIGHAETLASVEALAVLRVCSVLGPGTSRAAAGDSAARLAAAGVADRPWAGRVEQMPSPFGRSILEVTAGPRDLTSGPAAPPRSTP